VIGDKTRILTNKQVRHPIKLITLCIPSLQTGHTLRTKLSHVDEGGVSAGLGALDSVYLVQDQTCASDKTQGTGRSE